MCFNPYGPAKETFHQAKRIFHTVKARGLKTVCGYNYTAPFAEWLPLFEELVMQPC
ncbi:MAG: hypothetical protein ACU836_04625 [Gammaproteobacteria bacterium]